MKFLCYTLVAIGIYSCGTVFNKKVVVKESSGWSEDELEIYQGPVVVEVDGNDTIIMLENDTLLFRYSRPEFMLLYTENKMPIQFCNGLIDVCCFNDCGVVTKDDYQERCISFSEWAEGWASRFSHTIIIRHEVLESPTLEQSIKSGRVTFVSVARAD